MLMMAKEQEACAGFMISECEIEEAESCVIQMKILREYAAAVESGRLPERALDEMRELLERHFSSMH